MNLNEVTANIRLRTAWEAIDLGFSMVQNWAKSIYIPLTILTFGIATLLYLIVPTDKLWISSLIFWWLKPLYDRLVLHIISHRLFNNEMSAWQALSALPSLIWNSGFFQSMTFRRLSLSRGFNLSIWQLEKLRGKERATRQEILHDDSHSQAVWLTIAMIHLEMFLFFALFGLVYLLLPETTQRDFFNALFNQKGEYSKWIDIINYLFYVGLVTFLHPFYIAGSFALYINRRTQLEAWDIELSFKKLSTRLKETSNSIFSFILISFIVGVFLISPNISYAKVDAKNSNETEFLSESRLDVNQSKDIIQEVMKHKNLDDKKIVKRWVKKKKKKKEKNNNASKLKDFFKPFAKIFAFIIEFGLWLVLGLGIILLIYFRDQWLHLFNLQKAKKSDYKSPEIMFGMDVRPESLPDDIADEAQKLWEASKHRESLSLLYRGALVRLMNQESVRLQNSYTEGDVLHHSKPQLSPLKYDYLKGLTDQWRLIAYAHRSPAEEDMRNLFNHWTSDFANLNIDAKTNTSHIKKEKQT